MPTDDYSAPVNLGSKGKRQRSLSLVDPQNLINLFWKILWHQTASIVSFLNLWSSSREEDISHLLIIFFG